ncbi:MAG: NnrS family protein [Nevskiaceae bacterium]|nr:MAG: NnrS family protein [Nevskiaceae bacterium]TBR72742.1 MAG: NnrS family protein [Nevskiaceae bacterium]
MNATANRPLYPFRPMFMGAAAFSALGMLLWAVFLHLGWLPPSPLPSPLWHGHALLFGFAGALISGFLLTASASWTGMATTTPATLALLFVAWLAARIAFLVNAPLWLATVLDLGWLAILLAMVARVIALKRNTRNYFVIVLLASYTALDAIFLIAAQRHSPLASDALVWTVDWITILMIAIGGRVIPFFSGRKIPRMAPQNWPALSIAVNVGAALVLVTDILSVPAPVQGALFLVLALLAGIRLGAWHGWRGLNEPMLWSLHLGYLWLVIGLALRGLALLGAFGAAWAGPGVHASLHGITVGALGTLSLAMMTRVAQGHSGVPIQASKALTVAFLLPSVAALLRLAGGPGWWPAAACAWVAAYLIYLAAVGPLLVRGRTSGA